MKIGYSNILRSLVPAPELTCEEVGDLIIVCPECREPVFKVERSASTGTMHYLSHYQRTKAQVAECELRVERLAHGEITASAASGHADNMAYLTSCFRELLEDAVQRSGIDVPEKRIQQIMRNPFVQEAMRDVRERQRIDGDSMTEIIAASADIYLDANHHELFIRTDRRFNIARQTSIALDMQETLLTDQARSLYARLFAVSWQLSLEWGIQQKKGHKLLNAFIQPSVAKTLRDLPGLKGYKGRKFLEDWLRGSTEEKNPAKLLATAIDMTMITVLVSLDYLGWLHRRSGFAAAGASNI